VAGLSRLVTHMLRSAYGGPEACHLPTTSQNFPPFPLVFTPHRLYIPPLPAHTGTGLRRGISIIPQQGVERLAVEQPGNTTYT